MYVISRNAAFGQRKQRERERMEREREKETKDVKINNQRKSKE